MSEGIGVVGAVDRDRMSVGTREAAIGAGRRRRIASGVVLMLMASPTPLVAQTASQITPQSFVPPIQGGLGGELNVGASPGLHLVTDYAAGAIERGYGKDLAITM